MRITVSQLRRIIKEEITNEADMRRVRGRGLPPDPPEPLGPPDPAGAIPAFLFCTVSGGKVLTSNMKVFDDVLEAKDYAQAFYEYSTSKGIRDGVRVYDLTNVAYGASPRSVFDLSWGRVTPEEMAAFKRMQGSR